jgi:hypothetical protein
MRTSKFATLRVSVVLHALVAAVLLVSSPAAAQQPKPTTPAPATQPTTKPATSAPAPSTTSAPATPAGGTPAAGAPAAGGTPAGAPASGGADAPPLEAGAPGAPATADTGAAGANGEMPINLRLRRLEQRVQALKERAWRAKARVAMLKEAVLGGGVGAQATLVHQNNMGTSFRLIKLVYALDGSQIFARTDDGANSMYKNKSFDILSGPIAPGSHTVSVLAVYRGHGYGVFKYLTKYTFTVRSSHTFTVEEGKALRIEAIAFEKGGVTTPLEKRPAIDFKVNLAQGSGN